MGRLSIGMSRMGGKSRTIKKMLELTPNHEFFLSLFCGACWFELNMPRCRYEIINDIDSELINYLLTIKEYPKEFDDMKGGIFGLVSQEICNRIVRGEIRPKNNIERAYYFFYLNKLAFGGMTNVFTYQGINPPGDDNKRNFSYKGIGMKHYRDLENARYNFRGVSMTGLKKEIEKIKKAPYQGLNPNDSRPYTRNDNGLLSPLNPDMIKRLQYINITCYPFDYVYKLFYKAFHTKRNLTKEVFVYADPPYPGSEDCYKSEFNLDHHNKLIDIMLACPFNFMLSIGGKCQLYLDRLKEWNIMPVKVKYSTDANSQKESQEYIIMNYNIKKEALMKYPSSQKTLI